MFCQFYHLFILLDGEKGYYSLISCLITHDYEPKP